MKEKGQITLREPVLWKDFTAGYISGLANILSGQPFDICKVRMQTLGSGSLKETFRNIVKNEGFLKLWAGSTSPLILYGLCNSIIFAVNEKSKHYFRTLRGKDQLGIFDFMVSGSAAGVANSFISSPMEHIRIQMQVDKEGRYKNSFDVASDIYKKFGLKGIFRGFYATFFRELVLFGAYFGTYEFLKQKFEKPNKWLLMSFGGLAGISGWTSAYIIDSVKSKIQADRLDKPQFSNIKSLLRVLTFKELSKGFSACLYRAYPVNCITFVTFEIAADKLYSSTLAK